MLRHHCRTECCKKRTATVGDIWGPQQKITLYTARHFREEAKYCQSHRYAKTASLFTKSILYVCIYSGVEY